MRARPCAQALKPALHRLRDAFAYRCGGSTGWSGLVKVDALFPV
jgi:hypothetical protein